MDDRLERFVRSALQGAGEQVDEAKENYREARNVASLPEDEEGRAKIVCRRHAERRAALVDDEGHPACFDADHPDCQGCVEDIREGRVETWE